MFLPEAVGCLPNMHASEPLGGRRLIGGFPERQVQDPQNVTDAAIALVVLGLQTRERAVFDQIPDVFDTDILCARGNDLHQRRHRVLRKLRYLDRRVQALVEVFVLSELLPVLLDGDHEVKLQREQRLQSGAEQEACRRSSRMMNCPNRAWFSKIPTSAWPMAIERGRNAGRSARVAAIKLDFPEPEGPSTATRAGVVPCSAFASAASRRLPPSSSSKASIGLNARAAARRSS